jgi:hypothetical protein
MKVKYVYVIQHRKYTGGIVQVQLHFLQNISTSLKCIY